MMQKFIRTYLSTVTFLYPNTFTTLFQLSFFLIFYNEKSYGQFVNSFDIHYQMQQKGLIRFVSNAAVPCGRIAGCGIAQNQNLPEGTAKDNISMMQYINIDSATCQQLLQPTGMSNLVGITTPQCKICDISFGTSQIP